MNAYVVVEGLTDSKLIASLVPHDFQRQITIVPAGRGGLTSMARTLLVSRRKPVVVVADSDTTDEHSMRQLRREMEELIRAVAGGIPFKVILMVPEIESLFFRAPAAVERVAGRSLTAEQLAMANFKPSAVIRQFGQTESGAFDQIVSGLTPDEIDLLRDAVPIKQLIEFLSEHSMALAGSA